MYVDNFKVGFITFIENKFNILWPAENTLIHLGLYVQGFFCFCLLSLFGL